MTRSSRESEGAEGRGAGGHRPGPPRRLRDGISAALGVDAAKREQIVTAMLERHAREAVHYWLQLLFAMGIATMGLVLNSTAVVIGAMLISPLMGPIVELGMGLVVGSAFLAIRSFVRVLGSVVVVVACSAAITLLLPFHEVTPEVAARTSPTLLDLLVAVFCALVAAVTAVRNGSDSNSAAAGTAIGIALVPPLCVIGYGLGTRHGPVALGASLLFTANLSAIVLFAVLVFLLLGFDTTPTTALEARVLTGERATHPMERAVEALQKLIGVRYGWVLRLSLPVLLVVAVFVPLRRALEEVAWQVRVRSAIGAMLRDSAVTRNAVRSLVSVERHAVDVRLIVVSPPDEAAALERDLRERIARVSAVEPTVNVMAVPDFGALRQTVAALGQPSLPPEPPRPPDLEEVRDRVDRGLRDIWPREAGGALLSWRLYFPERGRPRIEVVHAGPPVGAATEALLARAISSERGLPVAVRTTPVPTEPVVAAPMGGAAWLPSLVRAVDVAARHGALSVCVAAPSEGGPLPEPGRSEIVTVVRGELGRLPPGRSALAPSDHWSVRVSVEACPTPPPETPDAGADAGDAMLADAR